MEVTAVGERLLVTGDGHAREASPINERVFLVDPQDPDNPTVTFGAFDAEGRPQVLYVMLWGLPRTGDGDAEIGTVPDARSSRLTSRTVLAGTGC